jgi:hypothetical protein
MYKTILNSNKYYKMSHACGPSSEVGGGDERGYFDQDCKEWILCHLCRYVSTKK